MNHASAPLVAAPGAATVARSASFARRAAEVVALVGVWLALGFALRLDAEAYLVTGIPLAAAFQKLVAGAPLRAAWVRDAPPLRLDARTLVVALLAAIAPLASLYFSPRTPSTVAWAIAGAGGALGVGYAARNVERGRALRLVSASLVAAVPGVLLFGLAAIALHAHVASPAAATRTFAMSFATYVPVCFAMEEVVFRGVIDAHLAQPGDSAGRRKIAALLGCALWGLWHLPVAGATLKSPRDVLTTGATLIVSHVLVGLTLARAWRRSGTLLVPAIAHALLDATRNALLGG